MNIRPLVHHFFLILVVNLCPTSARNNVCKETFDYLTIERNPRCWYDPDVGAEMDEVVQRYGFTLETHRVTTQDGYILTLFRIPPRKSSNGQSDGRNNRKRRPVLLQHGLGVDSRTWVVLGAKSLPFLLSTNGFDVWMANSRGTKYSNRHVRYTTDDPPYWNFDFHEMGVLDLPQIIDFIRAESGEKVSYVGHSMGTTMAFIYASVRGRHARDNVERIIALAPVVFMGNVKSATKMLIPFRTQLWNMAVSNGMYAVGDSKSGPPYRRLCTTFPFIMFCSLITALFTGMNENEFLVEKIPSEFSILPQAASIKTFMHYAQMMSVNKKFPMFDYGRDLNPRFYGSSSPPEYNLNEVKVPVHLFYGKRDFFADEKDVFYLYNKLNTTTKTVRDVFHFSHKDFVVGRHADQLNLILLGYLKNDVPSIK